VADGVAAAAASPERLVLIGVTPQGPELDYGWVQPGPRLDGDGAAAYEVAAFVEKPSPETGDAILSRGGLWNSMVLVGKVATFWNLGWKLVPEIMPLFARYREAVGTPREEVVLSAIYEAMPLRDFSKDVLQKAPEKLAVLPLENVLWSDWGRPERIAETLRAIGAEPAFSEEHLVAS
jgi:mannose-1-phosphate guanylyltransferase